MRVKKGRRGAPSHPPPLPEATFTLKLHEGMLDCDDVPWGVVAHYGGAAAVQFGPFEQVREDVLQWGAVMGIDFAGDRT